MNTDMRQRSNRKPYIQKQSPAWWLKNKFYFWYMLREGTSVFVFLYSVVLIFGVIALRQGPEAWYEWLTIMSKPTLILLHVLALVAAIYHATTWFRLAPKIMVIRFRAWQLPEKSMLIGQWVGFIICTIAILAFAIYWGR